MRRQQKNIHSGTDGRVAFGRVTGWARAGGVVMAGGLVMAALAGPASAATAGGATSGGAAALRPGAVVSLGDSYISGEAGRWKGNAADATPGRRGTDRAWRPDAADPAGVVDRSLVYGDTVANGCHRSDVAEGTSARLPFRRVINLACSGARTVNVLRASAGGTGFKGEAPQDDQLAVVARQQRVGVVVLSIGGNDLGFGSILNACVGAYLSASTPCSTTLAPAVAAGLPTVAAAVEATLADIRSTMTEAGYHSWDYRLVLQSYPAPLPAAGENRYSGTAPDARAGVGGCPLQDVDSAWTRSTLVPAMSAALAGAAATAGAQFLDLGDAFHGHELCASAAAQSNGAPRSSASEWVRFIDLTGQGDSSESLHPNAFGQEALGRCLALALADGNDVACHGVPGRSAAAVYRTDLS